jgi:hypothetical protein
LNVAPAFRGFCTTLAVLTSCFGAHLSKPVISESATVNGQVRRIVRVIPSHLFAFFQA